MIKHKEKPKDKKNSQLVLRIEKTEKAHFIAACAAIDSSAGREIRRFMREFTAAQSATQVADATVAVAIEGSAVVEVSEVAAPIESEVVQAAKPAKKAKK